MSHWNYRVLAVSNKTYPDEISLEFYEVYYNDEGVPDGYTANPVGVGSDTMKGLGWVLNRMKEALKKPVLWEGKRFPEEYIPKV
jgi:hypothetical protein